MLEANSEETPQLSWIPMFGSWSFETGNIEGGTTVSPQGQPQAALALSNYSLKDGIIRVTVSFASGEDDNQDLDLFTSARVVIGYDPISTEHLAVGLGGGSSGAYIVQHYRQGTWTNIVSRGSLQTLKAERLYKLRVAVLGQKVQLWVDDVLVIDQQYGPLRGNQVGLSIFGPRRIQFRNFEPLAQDPNGFVVMEFSESFDALYRTEAFGLGAREVWWVYLMHGSNPVRKIHWDWAELFQQLLSWLRRYL